MTEIVLPYYVRNELEITKGQNMLVAVHKGTILMKPLKRLSKMEGVLKTSKNTEKMIKKLRKEWDMEL